MQPKKQQSKAAGKRKRQQGSEAETQRQAQDVGNIEPHSVDAATTQRLRQAYPFLTHTRQAFVEGSPAHRAATQSSFPTRDELAKWKSEGGDPSTYPARLGNLAEWMEEIAATRPPRRPTTPRARAIARAQAEEAEEAEAQQADVDTETTGSAEETGSQSNPGVLRSRAKRSSRAISSTSNADAEEEEVELTPAMGKKARQISPKALASGASKTGKGASPSPMAEGKEVESTITPTKWIVLKLIPPKPQMPQIPGLSYEVKTDVASELITKFEGDHAYNSEETIDDPELIEMKDATSILMSMAADEDAGRQIEEANMMMSMAADQEAGRRVGATWACEAAEPMMMLSKDTSSFHDTMEGLEHSENADELLNICETDEQTNAGVQLAPAPVRMTFNLAHAPSRITNRPPKQQNDSLLAPPRIDDRGRAARPKKRKREEIEET